MAWGSTPVELLVKGIWQAQINVLAKVRVQALVLDGDASFSHSAVVLVALAPRSARFAHLPNVRGG